MISLSTRLADGFKMDLACQPKNGISGKDLWGLFLRDEAVGIIGAGAVGTATAQLLASTGIAVELFGRNDPVRDWVSLYDVDGQQVATHRQRLASLSCIRLVFVATKSFQLEEACTYWLPRLTGVAIVVTTCNGYLQDRVEGLTRQFPTMLWRSGAVTFGVRATQAGYRLVGQTGQLMWGPARPESIRTPPTPLEQRVVAASKRFAWADDIGPVLQKKWLFNAVINTLCGKYRLACNGDLRSHVDEVNRACAEAYQIAGELWAPWATPMSQIQQELWQLIADTADNENSMARDLRLGRRTEHQQLAGMARDPARYPQLTSWRPPELSV